MAVARTQCRILALIAHNPADFGYTIADYDNLIDFDDEYDDTADGDEDDDGNRDFVLQREIYYTYSRLRISVLVFFCFVFYVY